tara:strand:+ start:457 stop:2259 length:1803 start_codon:yes stop_codon:yes gene_type:complete
MLLILCDVLLSDDSNKQLRDDWNSHFRIVDLVFLLLFTIELSIRVYAFGLRYIPLNPFFAIDGVVVVTSLVLQFVVLFYIPDSSENSSTGVASNLLRIARLLRLLRLFVVMNKVQKARAAYKKVKYLKLGSPVERVIDMLGEFKAKVPAEEDQQDLQWIMDLIASDKLYTINIKNIGADIKDKEMSDYLAQNMGMKKEVDLDGGTDVGSEEDDITSLSQAEGGLARQQSTWAPGDASQEALFEMQRISELPELQPLLGAIHDWDMSVFEFWEQSQNSGLVVASFHLLNEYDLISKFKLSKPRLLCFLRKIQDGYRMANPYHNTLHALDVLLNTNYFLRQENIKRLMSPLDHLACLIGATIHDFQHPGINNNFLAATKHDYAITYNDQSILESHHVAASWRILLTEECNFLTRLSKEQFNELRSIMIQIVLGTDMKYHFEHCTKFKTKVNSDGFQPASEGKPGCDRDDVRFLLSLAVHTADIANPAKPLKLCLLWTEMVMEEFFEQGDQEARLGMPISPFYDREKTSVAQCQMGFINVLVKPLYHEFCTLLGEPALTEALGTLQSNLKDWETHGNGLMVMGDPSFLAKGIVGPAVKKKGGH